MLNHTRKIREIYEDIQRTIFYMIPEKWEELYLYSSVIDEPESREKGELFFYYIPKGIFKKKPVNVYEIPFKFNLEESEYLQLVELLYDKIKELRQVFRRSDLQEIWSNVTITIKNLKFRVEYNYENLERSDFNSYERHVIWRYNNLGIGPEQVNKEEKQILKKYLTGPKTLVRKEVYDAGIYIKDIKNIVDYSTQEYDTTQNLEDDKNINDNTEQNQTIMKNQILLSEEEIKNRNLNKKGGEI